MKYQHPVIKLIKERYLADSQPGSRNDPCKLGLAIEGGGMRGLVATSMASALHFLGLVNVFDAVYGSSAGALTGTFFITGKMPLGPTIFYENINNKKFIDLKRFFFKNKYIMDLDFLIYHVLVHEKPMNWQGVINSKIPLKIVVSSVNRRTSVFFDDFRTREELFTLLKASANIPLVAGPPVKYKDDLLFDASLYESIPYKTAISDGCTHVLCLMTRPLGKLRGKPSFMEKNIIAKKLRKLKAGLDDDYLQRAQRYKKDMDYLKTCLTDYRDPPHIFSIIPSTQDNEVSRLERDRTKLIEGAISGMKAVMKVFTDDEDLRYHEVLYPVNQLGLIPKVAIKEIKE
jgi:predicted patatin/cPLA2 family phospholipase